MYAQCNVLMPVLRMNDDYWLHSIRRQEHNWHVLRLYPEVSHSGNYVSDCPDRKVHGAKMRPMWGRQDPGGPDVGPMNFAIWVG